MATRNTTLIGIGLVATLFVGLVIWAVSSRSPTPIAKSPAQEQSDRAPIKVLDISERSFDNKPAIAILFSTPLEKIDYDKHIQIDLVLDTKENKTQKAKGSWVLGANSKTLFFPHVQPEAQYQIQVMSGLSAKNKSSLTAIEKKLVTTRKITPAFSFASNGSVLPVHLSEGLPIATVNIPEVDIQFLRVKDDKISQFFNALGEDQHYNRRHRLRQANEFTKSVYLGRFRTQAEANKRTITHVPVRDITELSEPGVYVAVMTEPNKFEYEIVNTHFFVTDIGLHARLYKDHLHVYARSLKTSKPISGVAVKMLSVKGELIESVSTDGQGLAKFSKPPAHHASLIAQRDKDISVFSFRDPALDLSEFKIEGARNNLLETYVYSNRDLYRPGERVDLSILLRNQDGLPVNTMPLHIKLKQPDGRVMRQLALQTHSKEKQGLGYYYYNYAIPDNIQTGKWTLEVRTDPASVHPNTSYRFHVEEFLPERMKLDLAAAETQVRPEESLSIRAIGAYLYGAPAAGNRIQAVLNRFPEYHPIESLSKYTFGDIMEDKQRERTELVDSKLNEKGEFDIKVKALATRYNSPIALSVTTSIFESGGRPVHRSIKRIVWPAPAIVGVKGNYPDKIAQENSIVEFEVVRADAKGNLLAAKNLDVKIIREDRNVYWNYTASRGWHNAFTESLYTVMSANLDFDAGKRGKIQVPVEHGSYRIEITDPDTKLTMRHRFFAGWDWESRNQANTSRPDRINVTLDKQHYKVGDTIKVKLEPPQAGRGLLLVESDQVHHSQEIDLPKTGGTFDIKVDASWAERHDVYVTAILYRPGEKRGHITPSRSIGIAHVAFNRDQRKLAVAISAPEKMQPSRKLPIKVKIDGLTNETAIVTVSAVDVGVLNITDYKTPNPAGHFFAKRAYGIDQYDIYGKVIESEDGVRAKLRFGGDAAGGLKQSKRDKAKVQIVSLFSGPVALDQNGEASIDLPVPDFNGSLRMMAIAFTADRFGASEREIIIAAPIIAEIATPRFLSPGDKSNIALDIHNLSGSAQTLQFKLSTTAPLKINTITRQLKLANKEKQTLHFDLVGDEGFGVGKINLEVKGNKPDIQIKREWELAVRPAYPGLRRMTYKVLKPSENYDINPNVVEQMMAGATDGTLVLSTTPPLNVRNAVSGLLQYPYGCLEQTTSRAFPLIYLDDEKALQVGLTPLGNVKRAEMVADAITRIRAMQKNTGGFGLWNANDHEEPWLSPYVMDFLQEARKQGFSVPDDMLKIGLKNLQDRVGHEDTQIESIYYTESPKHLRFAANAYRSYVLAKTQKAPLGTLRNLYDHNRNDAESGLPLVQLGIALKLQGDHQRGDSAITMGLKKMPDKHKYLGDYGTPERDRALTYALLARHNMLNDDANRLLFDLGNLLHTRSYLSTQDQLAIFLASHYASKNATKEWSANIIADKQSTPVQKNGRYSKAFSFNSIRSGIQIKSNATSDLYLLFEVNGYPTVAPKARTEDVEVVRTLYDMQGNKVARNNFKVGELLVAHVGVRGNNQTDNALLVDLLPAGFEIENLNITKGEDLSKLTIDGKKPMEVMAKDFIKHQEYRDDRFVAAIKVLQHQSTDLFYLIRVVSPGVYLVPPPSVEDMYRPDWRGIGATRERVTIENVTQ